MKFPSDDAIKFLFDHLRNLIICGTVTGAGAHIAKLAKNADSQVQLAIAIVVALAGLGLFALNFTHALLAARRTTISKWVILSLVPAYYVVVTAVYDVISRRGL